MFVSFSKRLKSMSGFRLGVGLRLTRRNCWYFLFVLVLVGCFYFCWYSVLACGWMLYGLLYGCYLMFKYAAIGTKKLYACIKRTITHAKHYKRNKKAGEAIEPRPLFLHDYTSERLPRAPAASSVR